MHFRFFKIKTLESLRVFLQADKKKKKRPFKRARDGGRGGGGGGGGGRGLLSQSGRHGDLKTVPR